MLGLGNRRTMLSNGFKKIVTAGLQLYYKATNTQAPLGEEQVRNNWNLRDTWTISDNKASLLSTSVQNYLSEEDVFTANAIKTYQLKFDAVVESGKVSAQIFEGGFFTKIEVTTTANNNTVVFTTLANVSGILYFRPDPVLGVGFQGSISNVSVKEITNSIKDHSKNSNDGILYSGKALDFDGTGDIVELNDANLPGEFAVCTWVKPDTFTHCVVFGDGRDENNVYLNLNWIRLNSPTSITVKINGTSTHYVDLIHGGNIAQDEWSRLIVTRDSDNVVKFGINGVFYSPSNQARAGNFNFNLLGRKQDTEMNGALADVQVYDKAWNATDVKYDWENPDKDVFDNSNSSIVVTDCKSLLRLNEGAGDRVYDAAPVLGEELNDLSWLANVDWSINGDIASNDGGSTLTNDILELGKTYQFKCKLSSYTSGVFSLFLGVSNQSSGFSDTDEFTFIGVCAGDTYARVKANSGNGSLSISSLTIKEIKPAESFAIVGTKAFIHQQPYIPQYAMSSFSKKMLFDGVNDYVTGSFNGNIGPAKDMTFSCWFNYEDVPTSSTREALFALASSVGDTDPFKKFEVDVVEGNKVIVFTGDGSTYSTTTSSPNSLTVNKLNHIAVSVNDYDASNGVIKIYINGVLDTETTKPYYGASNVGYYRIGTRVNSGSMLYKGIIDEVSLFKSELTQAEVLELYNSGSSFDTTGHSKYNLGEEVVDGGIDSISNWSFGDGWSYVDGKASLVQVGSPQATDYLKQELTGLVDGRTYVVGFDLDITSATVTTIGLSSTGAFGNIPNVRFHETSGRKTFTGIYDSSHQSGIKELRFVGGSSTEFTIDNVSVQEYGVSGYWRNNGADQWDDLSIGSSHGTVSGSPTEIFLQEVPFFDKDSLGMFMNKPRLGGLNFNGSGYVANESMPAISDNISFSFWIKLEGFVTSNLAQVVGKRTNSDSAWCRVYRSSVNTLRLEVTGSERLDFTIPEAEWVHVVTTIDDKEAKAYVNGSLLEETTLGVDFKFLSANDFSIGAWKNTATSTSGTSLLNGVVDDVMVYDETLTLKQVKKNYNATKSKHKN